MRPTPAPTAGRPGDSDAPLGAVPHWERDVRAGTTTAAKAGVPASRCDTGPGALDLGGRTPSALEPPSW